MFWLVFWLALAAAALVAAKEIEGRGRFGLGGQGTDAANRGTTRLPGETSSEPPRAP